MEDVRVVPRDMLEDVRIKQTKLSGLDYFDSESEWL